MTSNTEVIKSFNSMNFKKILSIKDMTPDMEYAVRGAYKTVGTYGEKIVLRLDNYILYLPSRFLSLGDEAIKRLCDGVFSVVKTPLREGSDLCKLELRQIIATDAFYSLF